MPPAERAAGRPLAVILSRPTLAALVELILHHCGLDVIRAADASEARDLVRDLRATLLLIEIRGMALDVELLASARSVPTLALIALESGGSSFAAFAAGADQVVRVPFTPDELAVRASALVRRMGGRIEFIRDRPFDGVELSLDERIAMGGRTVRLDPTTNSALFLLLANRGRCVTRDEVRAFVWGVGADASDQATDRVMRSLAQRLDSGSSLRISIDTAGVVATVLSNEPPS